LQSGENTGWLEISYEEPEIEDTAYDLVGGINAVILSLFDDVYGIGVAEVDNVIIF
jgi:hypothetical protein